MPTKPTHDAVLVWDQNGPGRLESDGYVRPVELSALRGRRVVAILGRRLTQVRATELPPASEADLRRLVGMRLGDLFPASADMAFSVAPRSGDATGGPAPAAVFAARNGDLAAIQAAAKANGFTVVATLPAAAGSVELAEELGMPDALILERDGEGVGLDVVSGLELVLSRRTSADGNLEGEVRRTFVAAKTGAVPIVATNGFDVAFADRRSPKTATAVLVERSERWPALDLVSEPVRADRDRRRSYYELRRGGAVLLAGVLLAGYVAKVRGEAAAKVESQTRKAEAQVRRFESTLNLITGDNAKRAPQTTLLGRAFVPAQRVSELAILVSTALPKGAWITNLTIARANPLLIRGTATESSAVATYLRNLNGLGRFRDVRLLFANTAALENKPVVNFSISAFPVGNIPLEEAKKRR